jgi:hypothetical protein
MKNFLRNTNITTLSLLFSFAPLLWAVLFSAAANKYFTYLDPDKVTNLNFAIFAFVFGFLGVVQIVRKEAPGLTPNRPIKGPFAVFSGLLIAGFSWGLCLWLLTTW